MTAHVSSVIFAGSYSVESCMLDSAIWPCPVNIHPHPWSAVTFLHFFLTLESVTGIVDSITWVDTLIIFVFLL